LVLFQEPFFQNDMQRGKMHDSPILELIFGPYGGPCMCAKAQIDWNGLVLDTERVSERERTMVRPKGLLRLQETSERSLM
jgi:hypothetical protein